MIFIHYITNTFRGIPIALSRSLARDLFRSHSFTLYRLSQAICRCSLLLFLFIRFSIFLLLVNKFFSCKHRQTTLFVLGAWCVVRRICCSLFFSFGRIKMSCTLPCLVFYSRVRFTRVAFCLFDFHFDDFCLVFFY